MTSPDLATRVYNHRWKIDPIVRSLIDTDFYKLLMCQSVLRNRPDVRVAFQVINRSRDVRLAELIEGVLHGAELRAVQGGDHPGPQIDCSDQWHVTETVIEDHVEVGLGEVVHEPMELGRVGLVSAGRIEAVPEPGHVGHGGELEPPVVSLAAGSGEQCDVVASSAQGRDLLGHHHLETACVRLPDGEPRRADHGDLQSVVVLGVHGPPFASARAGGC